ncbi:MAG: CHAT domain-containing protein, partial [Pseudomonadota bacterium]|nr:CHAT domain-containing protein [Pseudomonadota bacterium]
RLLWDVGADVGVAEAAALQRDSDEEPGYAYDRKTAFTLYQQIVAPVARLLEGKRHIFIATSGVLTSLPFGIMVTDPPKGDDSDPRAMRATKWFADAHALTVVPSIQSLQFLRGRAKGDASTSSETFVGYGDPQLEGDAQKRGQRSQSTKAARSMFNPQAVRAAGAIADVTQIRSMASLPGTAVELENMRIAMGAPRSSVHVQGDATESAIKGANLATVGILALATHGLMAGELPGAAEAGLVFTPPPQASEQDDGLLTASEIAGLKLDAEWVILSACNTAAGDGSEGAPGLSGLARAFLYAGARNLLASHWPVRDDVASQLTVDTIRLQRANPALSRAEALQQAMRSIRNNSSHDTANDSWAHPNAWAPFSLIGDGAG